MTPGVLSEYVPKSWFHPKGIHKVVADIRKRLPDVSGSLFLTFTINQVYFSGPESAFDYSRGQLRKLFYALRKGVEWEGKTITLKAPYCVKVEFHENGWPHFHVVFLTKRHLPGPLLNELWGLGRTNIKRIDKDDFEYLLKYVTKGGEIPEWVLKRERIRIFQTSRGFYAVPRKKPESKGADESEFSPDPDEEISTKTQIVTIEDRLAKWERMAVFHDLNERFATYTLVIPYREMLGEIIFNTAQAGRYLGRGRININHEPHFMALERYIKQ